MDLILGRVRQGLEIVYDTLDGEHVKHHVREEITEDQTWIDLELVMAAHGSATEDCDTLMAVLKSLTVMQIALPISSGRTPTP